MFENFYKKSGGKMDFLTWRAVRKSNLCCAQWCLTLCSPWTVARQFLCIDFPGKNTSQGCHFLLQRFFPAQGRDLHPAAGGFFTTAPPGKPTVTYTEKVSFIHLWAIFIIFKTFIHSVLWLSRHFKSKELWIGVFSGQELPLILTIQY